MAEPQFQSTGAGQNPFLANYLASRIDGKSMRALRLERESLIASLEATGTAQPATILWFNPVAGTLDGGIPAMVPKIPSILDEAVAPENKKRFKYKGRDFLATVVTIRRPMLYPWIKDVKNEDEMAVGVYKMEACKQIEIAHAFLQAYGTGNPSSSNMGGVVAFEGDFHALKNKNERGIQIKVPSFIRLPNGNREYVTESAIFEEVLAKALDRQKVYANAQTQAAQNWWDQEDQRGNITPIHRIWHQYEIDRGYRQTPAPWVTLQGEPEQTCEGCGTPKKRAAAYFCHNCGKPYSALQAYLDGEIPVTSPYLEPIWAKGTKEQIDQIHAEEKRREARRKGIEQK